MEGPALYNIRVAWMKKNIKKTMWTVRLYLQQNGINEHCSRLICQGFARLVGGPEVLAADSVAKPNASTLKDP